MSILENGFSIEEISDLDILYRNTLCKINIPKKNLDKFNKLKESIDTSSNKGKDFEKLITLLFGGELFIIGNSVKTSSNEIDIVIKLTVYAKFLRAQKIIPEWIPDYFIIECKNYNKPIEVGLVGKFYSLLNCSRGANLGIFFSNKPVSGYGERFWKHASAFIRKANLMRNKILLDINLDYLVENLKDYKDILSIIDNRKFDLDNDIGNGFYNYISKHENEDKLNIC